MTAQRILWGKRIEGSAQELIEGSEGGGKSLKAVALLDSLLRPLGNAGMAVKDIRAAVEAQGLTRVHESMGSW